jgi:muramoyltetrapeptide carboxypeptidase
MSAKITAIDHVQLAMPADGEDEARLFFVVLLGFDEVEKPHRLRGAGGVWFRSGAAQIHLGVERPFHPARKAHPCLATSDIDALAVKLTVRNHAIEWDDRIEGTRRFFTTDPFGNRLEFTQA